MMSTTGGLILGLFAQIFTKSGGEYLLRKGLGVDEQPLLNLLSKEIISGTAKELPNLLTETIKNLNIKRATRERLLSSGSIIDIAGVAWADILTRQSDSDIEKHTGTHNAKELVRRLDPYWFVNALMSPRGNDLAFELGPKLPWDQLDSEFLINLSKFVANEIRDELQIDEDTDPYPLVFSVVQKLPEEIHKIWLSLPGSEVRLNRIRTEAILRIVDGSEDREDIFRACHALATGLVQLREEDVFGRDLVQTKDLPPMRIRDTYVEPEAQLRQARAKDIGHKGPVKDLVLSAWNQKPLPRLVVLHAPFGYGKSLTFKNLAADLAEAWLQSPESSPFPILLKCPDVLSGHVSTLKAAVQNKLANLSNLALSAIERMWSSYKFIILLDGFDEVHMSEKEARSWFEEMQQLASGERIRILVASRPHAFKSKWLEQHDLEIEILPFDSVRAQKWLDATSGTVGPKGLTFQEISSKLDAELAGTPILLVMAAYGWNEMQSSNTKSRAAIYRGFINKISSGKWTDIQVAHRVVSHGQEILENIAGPNAFQEALMLLAWAHLRFEQKLQADDSIGFSRKNVTEMLEARFKGLTDEAVDVVTHSLCLSLFFRKISGAESVVFTHRSFREYLCAAYIVNTLRNKLIESHYISEAWLTLTEAYLGDAEINFVGELLQDFGSEEKKKITEHLDAWCNEKRSIYYKDKGNLQIEKTSEGMEIGMVDAHKDRSRIFTYNAERLSLAVRGVNISWQLRDRLHQLRGRRHRATVYRAAVTRPLAMSDGKYRVLDDSSTPIDLERLGYCVDTGQLALLRPIQELEKYTELNKSVPDTFIPVAHVAEDYYALSEAGLRVENIHLHSSYENFSDGGILDLGYIYKRCEKLSIDPGRYLARRNNKRGWLVGSANSLAAKDTLRARWGARMCRILSKFCHDYSELISTNPSIIDRYFGLFSLAHLYDWDYLLDTGGYVLTLMAEIAQATKHENKQTE